MLWGKKVWSLIPPILTPILALLSLLIANQRPSGEQPLILKSIGMKCIELRRAQAKKLFIKKMAKAQAFLVKGTRQLRHN